MAHCVEKAIVGVPLLLAAYFVFSCPCDTLLACHKAEFLISVGFSLAGYFWASSHG